MTANTKEEASTPRLRLAKSSANPRYRTPSFREQQEFRRLAQEETREELRDYWEALAEGRVRTRYSHVDSALVREALLQRLSRRTEGALRQVELAVTIMEGYVNPQLNGVRATFCLPEEKIAREQGVSRDAVRKAKQALVTVGALSIWRNKNSDRTLVVWTVGRRYCQQEHEVIVSEASTQL